MRRILNALFLFILASCTGRDDQIEQVKYHQTQQQFGSYVSIDICALPREEARVNEVLSKSWDILDGINQRMSNYREDSEISLLNKTYPQAVKVSADTYALIQTAKVFKDKTQGVFDITVYPIINLWKRVAKENRFPSGEEIQEAKMAMGVDHIVLSANHHIKRLNPDTTIDLGGIGVGFAVDQVVRFIRSQGFNNFMIDAAGDMYASGLNCQGEPWRIGIKNPMQNDEFLDIVHLSNQAITTSGDYEHYYEIQGQRFSHIINPISGYPQRGVVSATFIAPTTIEADAFATAMCILPLEQGMEWVNSMREGYASIVFYQNADETMQRFESHDFKKYKIAP